MENYYIHSRKQPLYTKSNKFLAPLLGIELVFSSLADYLVIFRSNKVLVPLPRIEIKFKDQYS